MCPARIDPEIEITPEMIRAGVEANPLFTTDSALVEEAVIAIYRAMRMVEQENSATGGQ